MAAPLFKESLTEPTLLSVLECAKAYAKDADEGSEYGARAGQLGAQVLEGLSSTRRFSMLLMFLEFLEKAGKRAVRK